MPMREIGSEFWDIPLAEKYNGFFPDNICWYLSGRFALKAIIEDICKSHRLCRVALPSWCCDSMIVPFLHAGAEVEFYSVFIKDRMVEIEYPDGKKFDAILLMDYFGYTPKYNAPEYNCIVIRDITHSMFSINYTDSDYYFGSLRKWAGFYTGGFAYKRVGKIESVDAGYPQFGCLRKSAMKQKRSYICGEINDKSYLAQFAEAEHLLGRCANDETFPHREDVINAKYFDIDYMKACRRSNAERVIERVGEYTLFSPKDGDCPLFVPVMLSNRNKIKSFLIAHDIFCPNHWQVSRYHNITVKQMELYDCELSLLCDQRYSFDDIDRMCDAFSEAIRLYC